jgi:hypothetical protein
MKVIEAVSKDGKFDSVSLGGDDNSIERLFMVLQANKGNATSRNHL